MLSKPMRRLACSTASSPAPATSIFASASTVVRNYQQQQLQQQQERGHQRRPSSSKASSCPPSGNKPPPSEEDDKRPASLAKSNPDEPRQTEKSRQQQQQRANTAGSAKVTSSPARRSKSITASSNVKDASISNDAFVNLNLPLVPPTNHLNLGDVKISSFFSLHRPISVTTSFPPTSQNADFFNSIFTPRSASQRANDVIYTLSNAASALEGAISQQQQHGGEESGRDLRWELVQQAGGSGGQMDAQSLEELVKQFRPFNVPPVPVPFDKAAAKNKAKQQQRGSKKEQLLSQQGLAAAEEEGEDQQLTLESAPQALVAQRRNRTYTSTLTLSESTTASGQRMWTARASPFIERHAVSSPSTKRGRLALAAVQPATRSRQPFLHRMRDRQISADKYVHAKLLAATAAAASNNAADTGAATAAEQPSASSTTNNTKTMLLISVKRQRKLKMKKHKYKKLMRRTRNLRKKEGRL